MSGPADSWIDGDCNSRPQIRDEASCLGKQDILEECPAPFRLLEAEIENAVLRLVKVTTRRTGKSQDGAGHLQDQGVWILPWLTIDH